MNKEINIQELINKSKSVENVNICHIPPMVSNGCAVYVDNGYQIPPAVSCATWYCNGVMMPISTHICGAIFPDRVQGFVDLTSKDNLLNGTCAQLTPPPSPPASRIIKT
jgi:hypothetical protein